jgi:hypothetical protein
MLMMKAELEGVLITVKMKTVRFFEKSGRNYPNARRNNQGRPGSSMRTWLCSY